MTITEAKYAVIIGDLRDQITAGALPPGAAVPSEASLMREHRVSRDTVRRALIRLTQEGLLTPGRPRTVARHDPLKVHVTRTADLTSPGEQPSLGADAWAGDMARAGHTITQDIQVFREYPGEQAARRLEISADTVVTARRLTRHAGGQPHNQITFWFPCHIADGTVLAGPGSITEGSAAWLDRRHGPLAHEAEVSARMPGPAETDLLRIPAGVPVMVVWRASRAAAGPVMCSMAVYPADRTLLRLDL